MKIYQGHRHQLSQGIAHVETGAGINWIMVEEELIPDVKNNMCKRWQGRVILFIKNSKSLRVPEGRQVYPPRLIHKIMGGYTNIGDKLVLIVKWENPIVVLE